MIHTVNGLRTNGLTNKTTMDAYVPNWIRPADPTGPFLQGYQIGQQRALAETQAMQRQAEMAMRAQEQQAERELQAQRIAEQADMNRRTLAANAAEVAQKQALAKQALDLKAAEAAQRMTGLRQMQMDIASGMTEAQAFSKNAPWILGSRSGQYFAAKERQSLAESTMEPIMLPGSDQPAGWLLTPPKGSSRVVGKPGELTDVQKADLKAVADQQRALRDQAAKASLIPVPGQQEQFAAEAEKLVAERNRIMGRTNEVASGSMEELLNRVEPKKIDKETFKKFYRQYGSIEKAKEAAKAKGYTF